MVMGYTVALGGALLDNAHLFEQVRHLAVSDPLTGLANYRHLLDVLENETERTNRSGRPFSVLLLDLDDLKKINDNYGHLVGSRAICRLGDVLRIHCRAIDTAARYGGDEFALVLPEAQEDEARRVASRIREVLASDDEQPPQPIPAVVFRKPNSFRCVLSSASRQEKKVQVKIIAFYLELTSENS